MLPARELSGVVFNTVYRIENCLNRRFHGVGRGTTAAIAFALIFQLDQYFSDGITPESCTTNLVFLTGDLETGNLFDRPEGGIDRTVPI